MAIMNSSSENLLCFAICAICTYLKNQKNGDVMNVCVYLVVLFIKAKKLKEYNPY